MYNRLLVSKKIKMFIKILDQIVDWRIALVGHLDEAREEISQHVNTVML